MSHSSVGPRPGFRWSRLCSSVFGAALVAVGGSLASAGEPPEVPQLLQRASTADAPAKAVSAGGPPSAEPSDLVATWDGGELRAEELAAWRTWAYQGASEEASAASLEAGQPDAAREVAIRDLALHRWLADRAEAAGRDLQPLGRVRLEVQRHAVLVPALKRYVESRVRVSDAEVAARHAADPDAFHRPRKLKLRNLYLEADPGDEEAAADALRRAEEIRRAVAEGADFAELARRESASQTAVRGGALGWVDATRLPAPVTAVVTELGAGELSPPVRHGHGVSLFFCEEVRPATVPSREEVRDKIRQRLERVAGRRAWADYQDRLLADTSVDLDLEALDSGGEAIVLKLPNHRLNAAEAAVVLAPYEARSGKEPPAEAVEEILRDWALRVVATRQAVELGLDRQDEAAEALRWRRLETLAGLELGARVQEAWPEPTEDALRRHYETLRRTLREPAASRLRAVSFGSPAPLTPEAAQALVETARAVAAALERGETTVSEAARRYSVHSSAADGGLLGWRSDRWVAMLGPVGRPAVDALAAGEATDLLHLDSGLWIFQVEERREARNPTFEEVRGRVRGSWLEARRADLEARLRDEAQRDMALTIHPVRPPTDPRVIRWSTASEFENFGYHVYRGDTPDGPFQRLTEEPIVGAGTSDLPHSYRFEDSTAEPGTLYYYFVESISTSGQRRRFTPVAASQGDPSQAP